MQILKLLEKTPAVASFEVLDFKAWSLGSYVKLRVSISDGSVLHVREYIDERERHYSFHWQDETAGMLCRWDNVRHHRNVKTFPHHKHKADKVEESYETSLEDVLKCIEKIIS